MPGASPGDRRKNAFLVSRIVHNRPFCGYLTATEPPDDRGPSNVTHKESLNPAPATAREIIRILAANG